MHNQHSNFLTSINSPNRFEQQQDPDPSTHVNSQNTTKNNKLLNLATPLLTLMTHLKHTIEHHNVAKLKAQIIDEIKSFEGQLKKASYDMRLIIAARYCLCTAIDEAVLSRSWGTESVWVQQSLLSLFHKETWGGERFYIILEEMAKDARQHIDFLEFAYALLSLGFEGKFFGNNLAIREEIRNRIFYRIRYSKEKPDKILSRHWIDIKPVTDQHEKINKLKKLAIITFASLVCISLYYNIKVYDRASDLINKLDAIANVSPITTFSQIIQRPVIARN